MPRLVVHPRFGRPIRMDPIEELGVPTQDWVEEFVRRGQTEEALRYLDYMVQEFTVLYRREQPGLNGTRGGRCGGAG